jgi:hypothetical protein
MDLPELVTLPVNPVAKAKLIAGAVGILLVLAVLIAGGLWLKSRLGEAGAMKAAQAKVDGRVQDAASASFDSAVGKYADHVRERETIKEKETHYVETIHDAAGANDAVPIAVHDAGIAAISGLRDASPDSDRPAAPVPH